MKMQSINIRNYKRSPTAAKGKNFKNKFIRLRKNVFIVSSSIIYTGREEVFFRQGGNIYDAKKE